MRPDSTSGNTDSGAEKIRKPGLSPAVQPPLRRRCPSNGFEVASCKMMRPSSGGQIEPLGTEASGGVGVGSSASDGGKLVLRFATLAAFSANTCSKSGAADGGANGCGGRDSLRCM